MQGSITTDVRPARLSNGDFHRLSRFIQEVCGINISAAKKTMLETRLQKRLRSLGMHTFAEYCSYLFSAEGGEREAVLMIDLVTTNKTDFFREPDHFAYLLQEVLPAWVLRQPARGGTKFNVWSAGCSTGEEPYTLAMVLSDFAEACPGFDYRILASDISTRVLETARLAVYGEERTIPVPVYLKGKFLLRSKERSARQVRIVPELREKVRFLRLNLMEEDFGIHEKMDAIFCRNVIIYFDRAAQESLLQRLCRYLCADGHLFLGHSESVGGLNAGLNAVSPTIYRKQQ